MHAENGLLNANRDNILTILVQKHITFYFILFS